MHAPAASSRALLLALATTSAFVAAAQAPRAALPTAVARRGASLDEVDRGRGLLSSTSQLNLGRVYHKQTTIHAVNTPFIRAT
jgi:hypothetical protein